MKLSIVCTLCIAALAASRLDAQEWTRIVGGGGYEFGYSLTPTSDGGFITGGTQAAAGSQDDDFWAVRFDATGTKKWEKKFGVPGVTETLFSFGPASGNGAFVGGFSGVQFSGTEKALMYRLDSTGKELWHLDVDYSSSDHFHFGFERREGGYYVGGHTDSKEDPKGDMWLIRYDANRNILWEKTYDRGASEHAHHAVEAPDGGVVMLGHTNVGNLEKYWVVRVDSNGTEKWRKVFSSNDSYHDSPYHIELTREGNYALFGGSSSASQQGLGTMWLLVIDPDGNILINKHFGNPTRDSFCWGGRQASDGGFLLAGYTNYNTVGNEDVFLVKTKPDGTLDWEKRGGGAGPDFGYDVIEVSDGYIVCGVSGSTDIGAGEEGDMVVMKFHKDVVTPALPSSVTLVSPAANATLPDTATTLRWRTGTPSVTRYQVEIATDANFATKTIDSSITDTSAFRASLANGGTYWWRVRARNTVGWGPYSETRKFTVARTAAAVVLISPAVDAAVPSTSVRLWWARGAADVTGYELDIATNSAFTSADVDSTLADTTALRSNLKYGGTYYWRVRAKNAAGWGPYSETRHFTIMDDGLSVDAAPGAGNGLALYQNTPNPFSALTTVRFHLPSRGDVRLSLLDLAGREVASIPAVTYDAGDHAAQFDGSRLPSGTYICRLIATGARGAEEIRTLRVTVLR